MVEFNREDFLAFLEGSETSTVTDTASKKCGCGGEKTYGEDVEDTSTTDEVNKQPTKTVTSENIQVARKPTIIDCVITKFLTKCMKEKSIPSTEQVSSITKLAEINRRYIAGPTQIGIRKGALDTINRERFIAGKNFEFEGSPDNIVRISKYD